MATLSDKMEGSGNWFSQVVLISNDGGNTMIPFTDLALDEGIAFAVRVLMENGVETFESCEGGRGHCFQYPTIRFFGDKTEGYRAFDILAKKGFKVICLQRSWAIENNEIGAPYWQLELAGTGQPVEA